MPCRRFLKSVALQYVNVSVAMLASYQEKVSQCIFGRLRAMGGGVQDPARLANLKPSETS